MKEFNGTFKCECGNQFEWNCVKLEYGDCIFGKLDDLTKNCKNVNETATKYIIELQCPQCYKKHFVEINK